MRIAALWNVKARQWIAGRRNIFDKLNSDIKPYNSNIVWIHCSSLGEFEQGRPLIEKLRIKYPGSRLLLTFFSPSGYEIRKDYKGVDWVYYLPMDSLSNARKFTDLVHPKLAIFIKYDYWYYYLTACKKQNIPLLLVSAIFRKEQPFFKWYGSLHRKMLTYFTYFFVQDNESFRLLNSIRINNVIVTGDTRFDRVAEIAANFKPIDAIERFCANAAVLVAGSTWPDDEKVIQESTAGLPGLKIIIAPHEIHEDHLEQLKQAFTNSVLYSQFATESDRDHHSPSSCLIIDNIGMLSRLYYYATITYVGGGFNKGIHNTLEPAVYGKPVLFGPNYRKFKEAIGLIAAGGGLSIGSANELRIEISKLLTDQVKLQDVSKKSSGFVQQNEGATKKIMDVIQENLRFTS